MHSASLLEISTDLPIVVEIVDAEEKVRAFLPVVDEPRDRRASGHARGGASPQVRRGHGRALILMACPLTRTPSGG